MSLRHTGKFAKLSHLQTSELFRFVFKTSLGTEADHQALVAPIAARCPIIEYTRHDDLLVAVPRASMPTGYHRSEQTTLNTGPPYARLLFEGSAQAIRRGDGAFYISPGHVVGSLGEIAFTPGLAVSAIQQGFLVDLTPAAPEIEYLVYTGLLAAGLHRHGNSLWKLEANRPAAHGRDALGAFCRTLYDFGHLIPERNRALPREIPYSFTMGEMAKWTNTSTDSVKGAIRTLVANRIIRSREMEVSHRFRFEILDEEELLSIAENVGRRHARYRVRQP